MYRRQDTVLRIVALAAVALSLSACSVSRFVRGSAVEQLNEPLPRLERPLARALSLDVVDWNQAAGDGGLLIGDSVARELFPVPGEVGREVGRLLDLNRAPDPQGTLAAINAVARARSEARTARGPAAVPVSSSSRGSSQTASYVARQRSYADEAFRKGDYAQAEIHNTAAQNAVAIDQSFAQAQATMDIAFASLGAAQALGTIFLQHEHGKVRRWIESQSGAIGTEAPEGSLLNVFLLRFFDARSFKLDSRQRVAVLVTLVDRHGRAHQSLEQSDLWVCAGECDLFPLPEGAVPMDESMPRSEDAHRLLYTKEGGQQLAEDGFLGMASPLHYVLLHHALENLEASLTGAVARR